MALEIKWVGPPASYTPGRARPAQYVTLHYTAGSEGDTSAEAGVAYDKRRTDGTSCHYFTDSAGAALQEVRDGDRSHSALWHGNEIGIHIEICGTAQTRAQWLDAVSHATLQTTAELVAHLCKAHGFPAKRLGVAETRAAYYAESATLRPRGINDHGTVTAAYPEDGGTHTDLGPNFPWDVFMTMVGDAMEGNVPSDLFPKLGDKSEGVKYLQRRLRDLKYLGATAAIDGVYDAQLAGVVKKYRSDHLDPADVGSGESVTGWMVDHMDKALAKIRTPKGDKGDPGPAGPAGKDGRDGEDGEDGADGVPQPGQTFSASVVVR